MEFLILGPLKVVGPGGEVELGGHRDRSLLTLLLINAGSVVSTDQLIEDIWGDPDATGALQTALFRLRRVLEPDRPPGAPPQLLVKRSPGYVLLVEAEQIDARRFEQLVVQTQDPSDVADRADLLRRALELWRGPGPALADFAYDEFAQAEIRRLNELRVAAQEELIDVRLKRGLHREVVVELEALVVGYPLRERLRAQLMLALYRSGRQTEALRVLQEARRAIGEESGLEPGQGLLRLEEAILREDPSLEVEPATVRPSKPERFASSNIPPSATRFIGREKDLEGLKARMAEGRIVTLVGPGGIGKTRLAVETAYRQSRSFPEGTFLARLERATNERGVLAAVRDALGILGQTGPDPSDLCAFLGNRNLLLILDGCEHVLKECAALTNRLRDQVPGLQILATSRRRLGVSGEFIWQLPPLSLEARLGFGPTVGPRGDAIELFLDRAHAANPAISLEDAVTYAGAADIVAQLDGMPLAIELAAAQCHSLPVHEIASRLGDDLRLLTSSDPTLESRQRTMQATIDWSYSRLSPAEQALFASLSVIPDSWDIEAAEALSDEGTPEGPSALELVLSLAEQSMVMPVVDIDGTSARFRILQPLRIGGRRWLLEEDQLEQAQRNHARYIRDLFESPWKDLIGPDYIATLQRLREEMWNFNSAFEWAIDHEPDTALRMAAGPGVIWRSVGVGPLVLSALRRSLAAVDRRDAFRARALVAASRLSVPPSRDTPKDAFDLTVAQARNPSAITGSPSARLSPIDPVAAAREALDISKEIGSEVGMAQACLALGIAHTREGDYKEAEETIGRGLAELAETNRYLDRAWLQIALAEAKLSQGDYVTAHHLARTAADELVIRRAPGMVAALETLARVAEARGRFGEAAKHYRHTLELYGTSGLLPGVVAAIRLSLGYLALRQQDHPGADQEFNHALAIAQNHGFRLIEAVVRNAQARMAMSQDDYPRSRQYINEALAIQKEIGHDTGLAISLASAGYVSNLEGDGERALDEFRQSLALGEATRDPIAVARALEGIAVQSASNHQDRRAAILIGAADTHRRKARANRHEWDDLLGADQAVRERLTDAQYLTAVTQGRELTTEEAIELALS